LLGKVKELSDSSKSDLVRACGYESSKKAESEQLDFNAFSCQPLLKDAMIRTRMENLRQLVDEEVITESQYKQALLSLYGPLSTGELFLPPSPNRGANVTVE
jgi:hypothetical protein